MRVCLQDYRPIYATIAALLAALVAAAGCSSEPPDLGISLAGAPVMRGRGDWEDVHAAVLVGAEKSECAIVSVYEPSSDVRLFRLQTLQAETAWLEVTRQDESERGVEVRMRARIGRFGDPERERALMARIAERLNRLAGVHYRPVP